LELKESKRSEITRDRAKKPIISGKYLTGLTITTYNSVLNNDYGSSKKFFFNSMI
jgi:hypothetical protein